jgi:NitT/TauT family transport system ATP-binding protein
MLLRLPATVRHERMSAADSDPQGTPTALDDDTGQLVAESVGLQFGDQPPVLDRVSFSLAAGEFVSIVGPSGCGKTTILKMIAGLVSPTAGRLIVTGRPGEGQPRTGFVFQEPNLLPWRTVVDNIRLPLELHHVPRQRQQAVIQETLQLIGLRPHDHQKYPRMLSGGMRMRVSLARALATSPEILLLDEPFAALDDMLRQQLNEDLLRIWLDQRWTGLFVTHNVAEAVFLSQRILVMRAHPGTIAEIVEVPFPYPRLPALRGDARFADVAAHTSQLLRSLAH